MMSKKTAFLVFVLSLGGVSLSYAGLSSSSKIEELKVSLKSAKGEKRSRLIKQIAEIENKELEKKRSLAKPGQSKD